ncbi:MAG: class I SAM-dependent DNA methyltransferase, partial [Verrucomicrobiia bacterium]
MAHGGDFGMETIRHFNGNLFDDCAVLDLTPEEVARIAETARLDWSAVDPSIFGTLFQRGLDPAMRAQLGAHFTGRADIEEVVDNVVMAPLRQEWTTTHQTIESLLTTGKKSRLPPSPLNPRPSAQSVASPSTLQPPPSNPNPEPRTLNPAALKKARGEATSLLHHFLTRLQTVTVLDPACGSGNFLYVTLLKLKDLEKETILYAMDNDLGGFLPLVGPWQLHGIEINPYAYDLAQMTVWIGWLQWIRFNGFGQPQEPILRPMTGNFRCMDAILDLTDPANPKEPKWEKVDVIVGNPPFLGGKMMRRELGDEYMDRLFALWKGRVPAEADLCCYWFEKARAHIAAGHCKRAGLLATQGIRGGANREVLKRIQESNDIFWAISDRDWVLDGANVHVSMVGFGIKGEDGAHVLDGKAVNTINAQLSAASDVTAAGPLRANVGLAFMGITPAGPFDVPFSQAAQWLLVPNPHGRPNSDVLRPYFNGEDLNKRARGVWTVDFGVNAQERDAAYYESPFAYLKENVLPVRATNARESYRTKWWLHAEARSGLRRAFADHSRYLATCMVAKYRIFVWLDAVSLPANVAIVFARSDDCFFGIVQSRLHEVWALKLGTRLETRPRYTPTTCFETFPFPSGMVD